MLCATIICVDPSTARSVPPVSAEPLILRNGDSDAVRQVIGRADDLAALVLVAPEPPDDDLVARLETLDVPTMVVVGTRCAPEAGRAYKRLIARCDLVYVYDAGEDVAADRPEVFAALVSDFAARREGHVVRLESRELRP
jgi:pimeloyl-ACP methyl ester carboxylesterase